MRVSLWEFLNKGKKKKAALLLLQTDLQLLKLLINALKFIVNRKRTALNRCETITLSVITSVCTTLHFQNTENKESLVFKALSSSVICFTKRKHKLLTWAENVLL